MKQIYLLFTLILILILVSANTATASLTKEASEIPYQVQEADLIIIGIVTDVKLSYDHTIVTIVVDEWLQNPMPAKTITIRTEGGKNVWVEDEASFTANETVLLMLEDVKISENRSKVLWGAPGKHPVLDRHEVLEAISQKESFDDQRTQASEVLTGEIVNVDSIPEEWDSDPGNFNYAGIFVEELEKQPDNYIDISDLDKYPYLLQAISNIHPESRGRTGHVEFHSFEDTALDDLLDNKNTTNIEVNNTYYEVNFFAQDPIAPISYQFNKYFEFKVNNVEKSSTNLTTNTIIKILYSDSIKYGHVNKGGLVRVWIGVVDAGQLNRTLNLTLYKTRSDMEGYDIEHLDSFENNNPETAGGNEIPFIGLAGMLAVLFGGVLVARVRR